MSCDVVRRCSLDLVLLWIWRRLAATALIRRLAWEPPHAEGVALKRTKDRKKKQKKKLVVPAVVQWISSSLGALWQVLSQGRPSGLRIPNFPLGCSHGLEQIPGPGTPHTTGRPKMRKKNNFFLIKKKKEFPWWRSG